MKIELRLCWAKGELSPKSFKEPAAFDLFQEYKSRLSKFSSVVACGFDLIKMGRPKGKIWVCHHTSNAKPLSSEELAREIQKLENQSTKELTVLIGPADEFSKAHLERLKPDFFWSFGPITLPHELAAVVAAEQLYRAYTILNHHPYHSGH